MTNEPTMTLVLKDATGNYFLVPQAVLGQGRVSPEQQAEVERLIAAAAQSGSGGDDAQGYILPLVVVGVGLLAAGAGLAAYGQFSDDPAPPIVLVSPWLAL